MEQEWIHLCSATLRYMCPHAYVAVFTCTQEGALIIKTRNKNCPYCNLFCVACISQPAKLYCSVHLRFTRGGTVFFSYIFYFCLKIKRHRRRRRGHLSVRWSVLLYSSALHLLYSILQLGASTFFSFFLNLVGLVLQLVRERESCLLATLSGAGEGRANLEEENRKL